MSGLKLVYVTVDTLAAAARANRTDARKFLDLFTQIAVTELNAGRPFAISAVGRLAPRKTLRTNAQNPRTNTNIGTRLIKRVNLQPYAKLIRSLN